MSEPIEYRLWREPGDLLAVLKCEDTRAGYERGMSHMRSIVAELCTDSDDLAVSPYSVQICRGDQDVTGSYGIEWEGSSA